MFPRGSSSQDSFSPRNHSSLPVSDPSSNIEALSPLINSVEDPSFCEGIPGSGPNWSNQHTSGVQDTEQPIQRFTLSAPPQQSATGLASPDQFNAVLSSDYRLNRPIGQPSIEDPSHIKQGLDSQDPRGLGISSYPMSVVSDMYFAGPMQHNSHQYAWTNRPYQPLQPQPGQMSPPIPNLHHSYPSSYPMAYSGQPNRPLHGYQQQEPQLSSPFLAAPGTVDRQNQPRSPHLSPPFPHQSTSISASAPLSSQSLMSPPPYMINQSGYYFSESPAILSQPTSISPPPPSMVAPESIYSSPESAIAADKDHPVRVVNSRPRPQCWDHECNGREFSTFSNLLRHQREKSGVVAKAECPVCGAVFTRTTARNIHVAQGKCKSEGRESSTE